MTGGGHEGAPGRDRPDVRYRSVAVRLVTSVEAAVEGVATQLTRVFLKRAQEPVRPRSPRSGEPADGRRL